MTAPPQNGNGMNPPQVPGNLPLPPATDTSQAITMAIRTATILAQKAAGDDSAAEAKDYAQAVLFLAQAVAVLDPNKTQTGTPLDHEIKMEQLKQQGALNQQAATHQHELQKAKQHAMAQAAAPSPAGGKGAIPAVPPRSA